MTSPVTILLFDEEPMLRRATALMLNNRGATVSSAGSLDEALSLMSGRIFDVAVLELPDKGPDAAAVLSRIRAQALLPRRLIVCTASPLSEAEARGYTAAFERPYSFDRLLKVVFGAPRRRRPTRSGIYPRHQNPAVRRPVRVRQAAGQSVASEPRRASASAVKKPRRAARARRGRV